MSEILDRKSIGAIALLIMLAFLWNYAFAVTVEPIAECVTRAKNVVSENKIPALPDELNGIPVDKLKGFKEVSETLEKGREFRTRIIAYLLIYDNIRKKLEQSYAYMKNATGEVDPAPAFGGKFVPFDAKSAVENCPYPLSEGEKPLVLDAINEQMKMLTLGDYENGIIEDKAVEIKRAAVFYSNAVKKTENKLERALKDLDEFSANAQQEIDKFIRKNIRVELRIGDSVNYSGIKKNFDKNDPILIGVKYWAEKVDGDIPLEWTIKSPDKRFKMGKMTITGGKYGEYVKIVEGKIPDDALAGSYDINIKLFPGDGDYEYSESYNIQGTGVQIMNTFVLGKDKKTPNVFKPGNIIYLVIRYKPFFTGDQKATFSWNVFDPTGEKVNSLSISKELSLKTNDKAIQTKYIKSKIPDSVKSGLYKFQAAIRMGSESVTSETTDFLVASDLTVKIIPVKTKVKRGEKAVFRSRIIGGKAPYTIQWRFDSGESSSSKDIAIVFTRPGKRWVTLTVIDSSAPEVLKKSTKIEVTVE